MGNAFDTVHIPTKTPLMSYHFELADYPFIT